MKLEALALALAVAAAGLLSPAGETASVAQHDSSQVQVLEDLLYYDGEDANPDKHRLNLVLPADGEPRAGLLWIHGGGWSSGDRSDDMDLARALAAQGVAVAVMSYRLSPGRWTPEGPPEDSVRHPGHIEDVARAFAWLWRHGGEHGLNRETLFVSGFSAGGHLSALLAMDTRYLEALGLPPQAVRGAIPIAGAYDIDNYYELIHDGLGEQTALDHVIGAFGPREFHAAASPVTYLDGYETPMLVISEGQSAIYTEHFETIVENSDASDVIDFVYFREETHASLYHQLLNADQPSPARDAILAFVDDVLSASDGAQD